MFETSESMEAIFVAAIKQLKEIQIDFIISAWFSDLNPNFAVFIFVFENNYMTAQFILWNSKMET